MYTETSPLKQGWLPVVNSGGPAVAPVFGVSWHRGPFTIAGGGHPYDGATGYDYPDPTTVAGSVTRLYHHVGARQVPVH